MGHYAIIPLNCIHILVYLFFVSCYPHVLKVTIAQKTDIGFKGNGRLHGPSKKSVTTESQWIQESLDAHNYFRSLHGSPPLVLNNTLNEISQYYANYLLQTNLKQLDDQGRGSVYFKHNPETGNAGIGENLYFSIMTRQVEPIPSPYAVLLWYEEIKDYNFSIADRKATSDPEAKIGHLTQLLWKNTKQMGTAYASSKLSNNQIIVFVVANYFPHGNLILRGNAKKLYLENVVPSTLSTEGINAAIVSQNVKSWWKESEPKSSTPKSWRNSALKVHNYYRTLHGSQPLRLNNDICKVSQLWANYLMEKGIQDFTVYGTLHQVERNFVGVRLCNFGETSNHFITPEDDLSTQFVLKSWYNQSQHYDFVGNHQKKAGTIGVNTDGFQQMIWNATTEFCMSFARKKAENGQYLTYVVANYYPKMTGVDRERKLNILPPSEASNDNIDLSKFDEDEDSKPSAGSIFLIFFTVVLLLFIGVVGSMTLLYKFNLPWYETVMKTVKLKK